MRYSTQIKPISYLKANAAAVLDALSDTRQPLIITQNGEARAVMQDLATYEDTQETLALLKLLAIGSREIDAGKFSTAQKAFARVRAARVTSPLGDHVGVAHPGPKLKKRK
jgi:prevent-host-death family protein